jgi:2-aminoadipate transaminase
LFLWVELPPKLRGEDLLQDAVTERVAFVPGAPFFATNPRHNFIRLNFSNSSPERIDEGISRLAGVLKRRMR